MGCVYKDKRSGGVVWCIRYNDVDSRERKERTKATTRTLARRILSQREDDVERARLQGLGRVHDLIAPAPAVTVQQFVGEYLAHVDAQCTPRTAERIHGIVKGHILPRFGSMTLREINPGHVQKFADERLKTAAPCTVRNEMYVLSGIFREALKRELVTRNPVALTSKPSIDNTIVRYLDEEEEERLLAFAAEPLRSAILISIHSGLREGELAKLTWADVRFSQRAIIVRHTKSKRDRLVPMSQTLYETLQEISRHIESPYVITNPETDTRYDRFNNTAWRRALKRAGIERFRWHDLRHTFGSRLAQAGVSITAIKELLGHGSISVTMRYAHLSPANLHTAVRALDKAVPAPGVLTGVLMQRNRGGARVAKSI